MVKTTHRVGISTNMSAGLKVTVEAPTENEEATVLMIHDDDVLSKFPQFMEYVEQSKLGLADGVLKVQFSPNIEKVATPEDFMGPIKDKSLSIYQQIFHGSNNLQSECYAVLLDDVKLTKIQKKSHPYYSTFTAQDYFEEETTCSQILAKEGPQQLLKHYFETIERAKAIDPGTPGGCSTAYLEALMEEGASIKEEYMQWLQSTSSLTKKTFSAVVDLENSHKDAIVFAQSAMKAKAPCSNPQKFFYHHYHSHSPDDKQIMITPQFSLSNLNTPLSFATRMEGINVPALYYGLEFSTFPCHVEDSCLWSASYLHVGHPKIWIVIPPKFASSLAQLMREATAATWTKEASCSNILGHKAFMLNIAFLKKRNIPYKIIVQRQGDLLILAPKAAHLGFSVGRNVAEAVNFATESWIEIGLTAPWCICGSKVGSVYYHLAPILAIFRPDLLLGYMNGSLVLDTPNYVTCEKEPKDASSSSSSGPTLKSKVSLICPVCDKSYQGGIGRLSRLLQHIEKQHPDDAPAQCKIVQDRFKKKDCIQPKRMQCPICLKLFSGNKFHLNLHVKNVHNAEVPMIFVDLHDAQKDC